MKIHVLITYVIILSITAAGSSPASSQLYDLRVAATLEAASLASRYDIYTVTAKLVRGMDLSTALERMDSLISDEAQGGMFYAYQLISSYLFTQEVLPEHLKLKIRNAYKVRSMYRGDTENHWVMYYTGLYLAAQTWPEMTGVDWFNGKSSADNFSEAEGWLNSWIQITTTIGQGEFDSPTYFTTFITPMLVLYEFAKDPVMKRRAYMMIDYLFADFAAEHLSGNYGGGHSRDYPGDIVNPLLPPSTAWAWLYFGKPEFPPWQNPHGTPRHPTWDIVFGALGTYRLPEIIYRIATDRRQPYVHTETKRTRNMIRFGDSRNPPVYKYTYMTSEYVLGSLHGGILQPIQQHTWDLTLGSGLPYNTIFTLHPYYSGIELAMFFPEEIKFLADEVDRYHYVYTSPDKWNSSSPYEQTFQHKDAIIVLYNIAGDAKHPHINTFLPKNFDELMFHSSGWILARSGSVYVKLYQLREYEKTDEGVNFRLRSYPLQNGIVMEVAGSDDFSSFEAFAGAHHDPPVVREDPGSEWAVSYTTRRGVVLDFTYDGERKIDGIPVDFIDYRLFNGPFLQSDVGSRILTIRHENSQRILDFNNLTINGE